MVLKVQPTLPMLRCIHPQRLLYASFRAYSPAWAFGDYDIMFRIQGTVIGKFHIYARCRAYLVQCRRCVHARSVAVRTCVFVVVLDACCMQG